MKEIKFRAWDKINKQMLQHKQISVLLKNVGNNRQWEYMQFTGLKDTKGVGIYEGDILKDDCGEIGVVRFGKLPLDKSGDCVCTYSAYYVECKGKLGQAPSYECVNIGDWMEVIGNIYEQPEIAAVT